MQPAARLGALLLEQGQVEEAEAVYRADLGLDGTSPRACQHPENVWSLHGYHECLVRLGKHDVARMIKQRLDLAAPAPMSRSSVMLLPHERTGHAIEPRRVTAIPASVATGPTCR